MVLPIIYKYFLEVFRRYCKIDENFLLTMDFESCLEFAKNFQLVN